MAAAAAEQALVGGRYRGATGAGRENAVLAVAIRADGRVARTPQEGLAVYARQVGIGDVGVAGAAGGGYVGAIDHGFGIAVLEYIVTAVAVVTAGPAIAVVHRRGVHTVAVGRQRVHHVDAIVRHHVRIGVAAAAGFRQPGVADRGVRVVRG